MKIAKINSYTPNSYRVLQNQNTNQNSNKNSISQNYAQSNNEVSFGKSSGLVNKVILPILAAVHLSSCAPAAHEVDKGVGKLGDTLATHSVVYRTIGDSLRAELDRQNKILSWCRKGMKSSNKETFDKAYAAYCAHLKIRDDVQVELQQHIEDSIYLSTKQRKHDSIILAYLDAYVHYNIEDQIRRINKELSQTKDSTKREELNLALKALKDEISK